MFPYYYYYTDQWIVQINASLLHISTGLFYNHYFYVVVVLFYVVGDPCRGQPVCFVNPLGHVW